MTAEERAMIVGKPVGARFAQETAREILTLLEERTRLDKEWWALSDQKKGKPLKVRLELLKQQTAVTERDGETRLGFTYGGDGCSQEDLKADAADPEIKPGEKRFVAVLTMEH